VLLDGAKVLSPKQDLNLLRAKVGMVFQKPTPFPMTIYENIAFGVRLYEQLSQGRSRCPRGGFSETAGRSGMRSRTSSDAERLEPLRRQQQRLCIARTVAIRPEVIFLDEPCSGARSDLHAKIEELIDVLKRDYTIAIVTHNYAAGGAYLRFTCLHVSRRACGIRRNDRDLHQSRGQQRTQDYITGRFG
jgi:phosphate transport system ATP-binding protein